MNPIIVKHRIELIKMLPAGSSLAEIGVWRGYFSIQMLNEARLGKLYLVDSWENLNAEHNEKALEECRRTLSGHEAGGRFEIIRLRSLQAAARFTPHSLTACYVDGSHDYQDCLDDLWAWSNVVRPDGFLMGHDYTDSHPLAKKLNFGVIKAVTEFCEQTDWKLTHLTDEDFPSFCLRR